MFEQWIEIFQNEVNKTLDSDKLQFTLVVWNPESLPCTSIGGRVIYDTSQEFPFLDMKFQWKVQKSDTMIRWEDGGLCQLAFSIFNKLNQRLKYLNVGSVHKKTVFHVIPKGVFY